MRNLIPRGGDLVPPPDPSADRRAFAAAAAEILLAVDAAGIIREVSIPDRMLARDLTGYTGWVGMPWADTALRESQGEVESLLRQSLADNRVPPPAIPWRLVEHLTLREEVVPLLWTVLPMRAEGHILAIGRDLMRIDLVDLTMRHESRVLRAHARATLARGGTTPQRYCLEQLVPAARRIGDLWSEDRCDVLQLTEAMGHLGAALDEIAQDAGQGPGAPDAPEGPRRRALLSLAPGEEHGCGIAVLAAFLRWAGWEVAVAEEGRAAALLRREGFDLFCLSAASDATVKPMTAAIRAARRASRNRSLKVMAGGWAFVARPGLVVQVGADATAADAQQAVLAAEALVPTRMLAR